LCKELAFETQMRKRVKSQFIQRVRIQRVVPPVPGERAGRVCPHTATLAREGRLCRMTASAPLYSDDKAPIDKIPPVSNDNVYANFERRTCKGRGGVVFRDRPGTGSFSPREWYCRLRQNSNQTEIALQRGPLWLSGCIGRPFSSV